MRNLKRYAAIIQNNSSKYGHSSYAEICGFAARICEWSDIYKRILIATQNKKTRLDIATDRFQSGYKNSENYFATFDFGKNSSVNIFGNTPSLSRWTRASRLCDLISVLLALRSKPS